MNPELSSLLSAWSRLSRREWLAVARLIGLALIAASVSFSFSGCVVAARPRGVVGVKAAPAVSAAVVIREAPPAPRREIIVERDRPSPAHVWIAGHWRHDGRVYAWVPGHWDRPPRARVAWVEPRWERRDGAYVFIEGMWR